MKKASYRFVLAGVVVLAVAAAPALAQVCSVDEGFESGTWPPADWSLASTGASDSPGFQVMASGASGSHGDPRTGTYCAWHNDDNTSADAIDWLILPQIDVQSGTATLTFWSRTYFDSYYRYHGVWISTGSGDPADGDFAELQEVGGSADWIEVTVDLSAYQGQTVWLAFRYVGDWDDEWYIDDVTLDACGGASTEADLSVTKTTTAPDTVHPGDQVPFTIRVENAGPADADTVVVTDVLPQGLEYDSCTGGCSYDAGTRTVTWNLATLANGASEEWTLTTIVSDDASGTITNSVTAEATQGDPDGANNQASAAIMASSRIPGIPATTPAGTAALLLILATAGAFLARRRG